MSLNDPLANALSTILNCENNGKNECYVKPFSKPIKIILELLNKNGFLGEIEEIEDGRGNFLKVKLIGQINKCGVIKPSKGIKKEEFESVEKRFLPAKDFGIIIISTVKGIITNKEAKENNIGGKVLAYCY